MKAAYLEEVQVLDPVVRAQSCSDECCQLWVAVSQPAAGGDAVGLVLELLGEHLHEVLEDVGLDDLAVDSGHAVHCLAADCGKEGHVHKPACRAHTCQRLCG